MTPETPFDPSKVERFPAYRGMGGTHYSDCVAASDFNACVEALRETQRLLDSYKPPCGKEGRVSSLAGYKGDLTGKTVYCLTCRLIDAAKREGMKAARKAVRLCYTDDFNPDYDDGVSESEIAILRLLDKEARRLSG